MKKHQHLLSKLSTQWRVNRHGWHITFRGNLLMFGPGLLGTLGIFSPFIIAIWAYPDLDPKGTSTESRERCWTLCFPLRICAKWVCAVLYFQVNLLIGAPVPIFYDVSYKVHVIYFFSIWAQILILFCLKLRAAFAHRVKDGSREVYNTLCLLIRYLISRLVVFRSTYFPGWLALH